jgi:general transcription factor 3C polypeptide 3 (transcription factor C subunit 4)
MEGVSQDLDPTHPRDTALTRQSQYPDPEASGITSSAWPASSLPYGADNSITACFHSNNHEAFSLPYARAEFELASARRRSQSRELSEESDFLEELSDNE